LEQQQVGQSNHGRPLLLHVAPTAKWRISGDFFAPRGSGESARLELRIKDESQPRGRFLQPLRNDEALRIALANPDRG